MNKILKSAWLLAALSGGLQVVIFPTPNLYWLCWIALAPLLLALLRARTPLVLIPETLAERSLLPAGPGAAFLLGWLSGILCYAGSCYWVLYTMHAYGNLPLPVAFVVLVLFCLTTGAYTGLFAFLVALVANGPGTPRLCVRRALVFAPFFWVMVELLRSKTIGFAWNLLGTVQVDNIPLTRLATVTGVYGISFEIVLVNTAFAAALLARRQARTLLFAAALIATIGLQLTILVQPPPSPASGTARLVQQNLPIDANWSSDSYTQTLVELGRESLPPPPEERTGEPAPDLIVWPESPAPFEVNDPLFHTLVSKVAIQTHAYVIVGAVGINKTPTGSAELPEMFNSAALVTPEGRWAGRYDKIHLVPFGEYVPFKTLLGFAHQLTREVGNFVPGAERQVFAVDGFKLGTFICYESIFPGEVRQFAANGAELFVNISNDEWFGHTAAPYQHLNQARMRAIENRRWLLRDTNTGITAAIDPYGRVVEQAPRDVLVALSAPYGVIRETTFYTRHGDWFSWLCVIISLIAVAASVRQNFLKRTRL